MKILLFWESLNEGDSAIFMFSLNYIFPKVVFLQGNKNFHISIYYIVYNILPLTFPTDVAMCISKGNGHIACVALVIKLSSMILKLIVPNNGLFSLLKCLAFIW